ncbi:MAG: pyruvate formate lyase family protein [Candidatus Firestonebacteria bacterium]
MRHKNYSFQERLDILRKTKLQHTKLKSIQQGAKDMDDWGQIPYEGGFIFVPETDHPKGYVIGSKLCGKNFRLFLEKSPTYISKLSSLLGGYYFIFASYVTKWDPENYWVHLAQEQKKYNILSGITASHHFGMDLKLGLELGFGGILDKIKYYREKNSSGDIDFYDALENVVIGIQNWIKNHIKDAKEAAKKENHLQLKNNLEEMVEINTKLITNPPETFREVCQWAAWYQMAARVYNGSGALGNIDQLFYPYYKKDKERGYLTDEEAIFHLACLNITDPQYIHIGGIDEKGKDITNELSFLILEAVHSIKIAANIAVDVHDNMDKKLLYKSVELLFKDKLGIPRFFSIENMAEGFAKNGIPIETARKRIQVGCHWFSLPGSEYCVSDVIKINFAKVFDVAFHEMMEDFSIKPTINGLWNYFEKHLKKAVEVTAQGIDLHMEYFHKYFPELVLDILCYGPIEKGVDATHGSLKYNTIGVDGAGLATVADSFAAIELRVEKEKRITWKELLKCIDVNFTGEEKIRLMLQNIACYGRGETRGDYWAKRLSETFTKMIKEKTTPAGWTMIPGLFSWASTIEMGKETGATPNGRRAGEPISFGANPDPGVFKGGSLTPTSLAIAVAKVQPGYGNTAPLQLDVDSGLIYDENGIEKLEAIITGHFKLGGTLINANVLDKEKIYEAYKNPSKYPDLIVRVTGFSAYFASLSDEFRKLVYERIVSLSC